jgi:hypothetical protein
MYQLGSTQVGIDQGNTRTGSRNPKETLDELDAVFHEQADAVARFDPLGTKTLSNLVRASVELAEGQLAPLKYEGRLVRILIGRGGETSGYIVDIIGRWRVDESLDDAGSKLQQFSCRTRCLIQPHHGFTALDSSVRLSEGYCRGYAFILVCYGLVVLKSEFT